MKIIARVCLSMAVVASFGAHAIGRQTAAAPLKWLIFVTADVDRRTADGVEFGIAEAAATARLIGANVELIREAHQDHRGTIGIIAGSGRARLDSTGGTPIIYVDAIVEPRHRCQFFVAAAPDDPKHQGAIEWHESLERFGAAQLNERFRTARGRLLRAPEWRGWFAVKVLIESHLRTPADGDVCRTISQQRFDGHKGVPLIFDGETGRLRQPLYAIQTSATGGRIIREIR